jgi:hypothetical protein
VERSGCAISGNLVTIGCKRQEDSGRRTNISFGNYSNVKLVGCDAYGFLSSFYVGP